MFDQKGLYQEVKENYYKFPAQLPPLTWLDDSVPASPKEVFVERQGDELRLSWQKPEGETRDLTYTVYYSLADSVDTSLASSILATNIHGTELFLPVNKREQGFVFRVSASTRYHVESKLSEETYYYLSEYEK